MEMHLRIQMNTEKCAPVRVYEPRPRRWERRILATRPHGIEHLQNQNWFYEDSLPIL